MVKGSDNEAINILGIVYEKGLGIDQDYLKAFDCYRKAAYIKDIGQRKVNIELSEKKIERKDKNEVIQKIEKLLERYKQDNMSESSKIQEVENEINYETPVVITGDEKDIYYEDSALYQEERVFEDAYTYQEWHADLVSKAENDDDDAMFNLGILYEEGLGVDKNYKEAKKWYERSARKGNNGAMHNLARFYRDGLGVEQNKEKAKKWYRRSKKLY